jgi:hypothetical protein
VNESYSACRAVIREGGISEFSTDNGHYEFKLDELETKIVLSVIQFVQGLIDFRVRSMRS